MGITEPKSTISKQHISEYFKTDHLKTNLKERTIKGGFLTVSSQGIKLCLNTVSTIFLARLLSPNDFGLIAMVNVFIGFVSQFKDLGLSMATVQKENIDNSQVSNLFWINVFLSICISICSIIISPLVVWFYNEPKVHMITIVISCTFIFGGFSAQHSALLKRQMRYDLLAYIQIISMFFGILIALFIAYSGAGYWALVGLSITQNATSMILHWSFLPWVPSLPKKGTGLRPLLSFGKNLTGFSLFNYLARNADNFIIGKWIGPSNLGIYSKAYNLLLLPLQQIAAPIGSVAIPSLSRLNKEPIKYRQAFLQFQSKLSIIIIPAMTFLLIAADSVVLLILGNQWKEAITVFRWLSISGILQGPLNSSGWLFTSQGRTKEMFHWGIVSSIIAIISFIIGLPWGINGVAASYGISGLFISSPLLIWWVGRKGHVSSLEYLWSFADGFKIALLISISCLSAKFLCKTGIPLIDLSILIIAAFFAITIYVAVSKTFRFKLINFTKYVNYIFKKDTKRNNH